eukprot:5740672-Prymnesium_polylepis.1
MSVCASFSSACRFESVTARRLRAFFQCASFFSSLPASYLALSPTASASVRSISGSPRASPSSQPAATTRSKLPNDLESALTWAAVRPCTCAHASFARRVVTARTVTFCSDAA